MSKEEGGFIYMKQDRVEFRASRGERELFEKAAVVLGMNLSSFMRMTAVEKSVEILRQRDSFLLSNRDRNSFLEALENPPQPNKEMKNALKIYQRQLKNG
jgi:uncharacterized protein (DUF1778 family)